MPQAETEIANVSAPLEADDSSALRAAAASAVADDTQSLTESIMEHVYENGRRYHRKSIGKYALPSDETEQDRLDITHHMYLEMLGGRLTLTPFEEEDPQRVLDCGTGTGIWALDYGDMHPESEIQGVDLAPIQPIWTYPNVRFEVDDLELEWLFPENHFNFIHSRDLVTAIKDWPRYFAHMYKHLRHGGYVEISEHSLDYFRSDDSTLPPNSCYQKWLDAIRPALEGMGAHPRLVLKDYERMLQDAGFVDIETYEFKVPVGSWPRNAKAKRLGRMFVENARTGFEAYGKHLMIEGGLTEDEATALITECIQSMMSNKMHAYYLHWQLVARKPGILG